MRRPALRSARWRRGKGWARTCRALRWPRSGQPELRQANLPQTTLRQTTLRRAFLRQATLRQALPISLAPRFPAWGSWPRMRP
ncbi:hypothetical protein DBL07_21105 [Achromobacter mucicolens]|uniref:pentapeptide repeat-containing protein n=1 Tax=Achromobacter mucicolens TaxID=1389922 RepID=UPI000D453528|nr:hypothetical protein DBL07_21105 [Achromobacter mucicolens]